MSETLIVWMQLLAVLACEAAIVVLFASRLTQITKSPAWRRTIWQVCFLSLVLLVAFELTGTARGVLGQVGNRMPALEPGPGSGAAVLRHPSATPIYRDSGIYAVLPGSTESTPESAALVRTEDRPSLQSSLTTVPQADSEIASGGAAAVGSKISIHADTSPADDSYLRIFMLTWLAGAILVLGRVCCSRMAMEIFRWRHGSAGEAGIGESVLKLAGRLGLRRQVRLLTSSHFSGPITFGILRPAIGLPPGFSRNFSPTQQEAMLAHELAHLAGHDPAWYLVADGLTAAFWWHPLVWWARRRLHAESEQAADEASLLVADGPGVLAECLVELGARLARRRTFGWMGVVGNGFRSGLGRRVERLVSLRDSAWRPPNRIHCALVRVLCPIMLVATTIFCTAWAVPQALTKGENMQTMKETWKQSLAAFALMTAVGTEAYQADQSVAVPPRARATMVTMPAPDGSPGMAATAMSVPVPATRAQSSAATVPPTSAATATEITPGATTPPATAPRPGFGMTSGATVSAAPAARGARGGSNVRAALQSKLQSLTLEAVEYPGIPLDEVIRGLIQESAKLDSEKVGVNFLLDRSAPDVPGPRVDPNTGLVQPVELPDLSKVTINVNPPLKHIRMSDLLDAIIKAADHPIRYSVQNYGVVFSLDRPDKTEPAAENLISRTFKVDTNTFFAGLENAFGIRPDSPFSRAGFTVPPGGGSRTPEADKSRQMEVNQLMFRRLLDQLGVNMQVPNKAIYYNELTGIVMMRGTYEDLEVFSAAIETLGGAPLSRTPNTGGSGLGGSGSFGGGGRGFGGASGGFGGGGSGLGGSAGLDHPK